MTEVTRKSRVTLHHQLGLMDGSILEDTFHEEPMVVQLGSGEMAQGLEFALLGLKVGEQQTIDIEPELAFGYADETLLRTLARAEFDPELELHEGLIIEFSSAEGKLLPGTIVGFDDDSVRVDLNHPLAGETVRYTVKIVDVEDTETHEEIH